MTIFFISTYVCRFDLGGAGRDSVQPAEERGRGQDV